MLGGIKGVKTGRHRGEENRGQEGGSEMYRFLEANGGNALCRAYTLSAYIEIAGGVRQMLPTDGNVKL